MSNPVTFAQLKQATTVPPATASSEDPVPDGDSENVGAPVAGDETFPIDGSKPSENYAVPDDNENSETPATPQQTLNSSPDQAQPTPPTTPPAPIFPSSSTALRRFHFVIGGGYLPPMLQVIPQAEPFRSAAPTYQGPGFFGQFQYSLMDEAFYDFRAGVHAGVAPLSIENIPGIPSSGVTKVDIMLSGEANFYFGTPNFGGGVGLLLGYSGLISDNADVGAPHSATLEFGSEGGLGMGAQFYLHAWRNALRAGAQLNLVPTDFGLATGEGQPDLRVGIGPHAMIFGAVDVARLIDNMGNTKSWNTK